MLRWLLIFWTTAAYATSCGVGLSPKEKWRNAPLVFAGQVALTLPEDARPGESQAVLLRVEEPFKGVTHNQLVPLQQGPCLGCNGFREGQRGLFYLMTGSRPGTWTAYLCGYAKPLHLAADDLDFLRGLPGSAAGTRLSGQVTIQGESGYLGPVAGVPVRILSGGRTWEVSTNTDGVFVKLGLPPGTYDVRLTLPGGLREMAGFLFGGHIHNQRDGLWLGKGSHAGIDLWVTAESNSFPPR